MRSNRRIDEVKVCVDAKVKFFELYFEVPNSLQGEVDAFIRETTELGENCSSAAEFEEKLVSTGLSDRFNGIIPKCHPKSVKMTKEQKRHSVETAKEILKENRKELAKNALTESANRVFNDIRDEQISQSRERMLEEGTMADYTIARNRAENVRGLFRFLKNKKK